jgi:Domain of unknown function (DUF6766)
MLIMKKYAYAWITIGFFLVSLILHWHFGWRAYVHEANQLGQQAEWSTYSMEALRDTFENWQSEFLQLLWQVVGLAYFLYVGSPASKENDDRTEAKIDALLHFHGEKGRKIIEDLDEHFERHGGHAKPHGHDELDRILKGEKPKLK